MLDSGSYSEGFLKQHNFQLRNSINTNEFKDFSVLQTDEERFSLLYSLPIAHSCDITLLADNVKNSEVGNSIKDDGNKAFLRGEYKNALKLYNESVQKLPWCEGSCSELAVVVANRSAALYHLKRYQHALDDIQLALSLGYPPQLHYKVHERKARCLLATNQLKDALEAFKMTLQSLDVAAKLSPDKRMKTQKDIQIMIAILLKNEKLENAPRPMSAGDVVPALNGEASKKYQSASSAVTVVQDKEMGRYATANRDIFPGETIVVEQPHCAVLLAEYSTDHCTHCFKRVISVVPCHRCCNVVFCSLACQEKAESSYHGFECCITEALWASGASVTSLMALRILSQRTASFFLDMKPLLSQVDTEANRQKLYRGSDYTTVYQLVRHEDQRTPEDFFQRTAVAVFLFRCLKLGGYFGPCRAGDDCTLTADERFIGGLLLRHLQLLQFNAHEVSELQLAAGAKPHTGNSKFIGGGLYPTLALFNHSCEPSIVRYFHGTHVVVRTVKTVRAGEMVAENYGPIFTQVRREARRNTLQEQYWFQCQCTACQENWPLFEEMDSRTMRFRCGAEANSSCSAVVLVPIDTTDFMVRCPSCGGYTNIMKGLKTLQDTDAMFQTGSRLMEAGQTLAALTKFLDVLCLLDETLVPPFLDYHLCQQSIRRCMLSLGNICRHAVW